MYLSNIKRTLQVSLTTKLDGVETFQGAKF